MEELSINCYSNLKIHDLSEGLPIRYLHVRIKSLQMKLGVG